MGHQVVSCLTYACTKESCSVGSEAVSQKLRYGGMRGKRIIWISCTCALIRAPQTTGHSWLLGRRVSRRPTPGHTLSISLVPALWLVKPVAPQFLSRRGVTANSDQQLLFEEGMIEGLSHRQLMTFYCLCTLIVRPCVMHVIRHVQALTGWYICPLTKLVLKMGLCSHISAIWKMHNIMQIS